MRLRLVSLAAVLVLLSGCAQTFDATRLGVPATMAGPLETPADGDRFKVSSTSLYAFWGVLSLSQADLEKALRAQLAGGKGVADLKITVRSRWTDLLFTAISAGIFVPRTVTFEGVIVDGKP